MNSCLNRLPIQFGFKNYDIYNYINEFKLSIKVVLEFYILKRDKKKEGNNRCFRSPDTVLVETHPHGMMTKVSSY